MNLQLNVLTCWCANFRLPRLCFQAHYSPLLGGGRGGCFVRDPQTMWYSGIRIMGYANHPLS